jgi:hypothetical protein
MRGGGFEARVDRRNLWVGGVGFRLRVERREGNEKRG